MNSPHPHKWLIILIVLVTSCKSRIVHIETGNVLEKGVYLCYGQKNCFNCLTKFSKVGLFVDSVYNMPLSLIIETNHSSPNVESKVKVIAGEVGYKFNKYLVDQVEYNSPFTNTGGYLKSQGLEKFPAVILSTGKVVKVIKFENLFNSDDSDSMNSHFLYQEIRNFITE
jgi:hypothetical protein